MAVACIGACKTPDGPRIALPPQSLETPVPQGYARVVIFNDTPEIYLAEGHIRIQVGGFTAPSLYLNHYVQLFLLPGAYEFLFEHWDFVMIKDRYAIEISEPETFIRIRSGRLDNEVTLVDELPSDFLEEFVGGRDPAKWPGFPLTTPSSSPEESGGSPPNKVLHRTGE